MKRNCLRLFVAAGWLGLAGLTLPAQTNAHGLQLTGLINLPSQPKAALIYQTRPPWPVAQMLVAGEGQRDQGVELRALNARTGTVEVRVDSTGIAAMPGKLGDHILQMPPGAATATVAEPTLWLQDVDVSTALDCFAQFTRRTVLKHPALTRNPISLRCTATNLAAVLAELEQALATNNVVLLPDGPRFTQALPTAFVQRARTNAPAAGSGADATYFKAGNIFVSGVDVWQVATAYYAPLLNRTLESEPTYMPTMRAPIFFRNHSDLTRAEFLYALDTLFAWYGVKLVAYGEKVLKVAPVNFK